MRCKIKVYFVFASKILHLLTFSMKEKICYTGHKENQKFENILQMVSLSGKRTRQEQAQYL